MSRILIEPLTNVAFAPFGEVVEMEGAKTFSINEGFAERCNGLAGVDVAFDGGSTNIGLAVANPRPFPFAVNLMERHPLGSQIFMPLQDRPWLILVCTDPHDEGSFRAFSATGRQGVNYARNVWHHTLIVLDPASRFLIVDRGGPGDNLEECFLKQGQRVELMPSVG